MQRFVVFLLLALAGITAASEDVDEPSSAFKFVTCGSALKLRHVGTGYYLHSHPIRWSSGSGQQSVTAFGGEGDTNSLWQVRSAFGQAPCAQGTPVPCGSVVRLSHVRTGKFLHSHLHASPLSRRQEISGFGDVRTGESDTGDNWRVECVGTGASSFWERKGQVRLVHLDTGKALFTSRSDMFEQNNCPGCPILGQLEVTGHSASPSDKNALWTTADGYYFAAQGAAKEPEDE